MNRGEKLSVYRGCTPVVDAEYGFESDRSAIEAIAVALADATGTDPVDLPSLYGYVDPDALNALFERSGSRTDGDVILSFRVETWNVFVRSDGRIRVCDGTRPTAPEPVFDSPVA